MIKIVFSVIILLLCSCGSGNNNYFVKGVIKKIPEDSLKIIIAHDTIPNLMMPMVMPFNIKNKIVIRDLQIGDSVHFDFIWNENHTFAENFRVVGKSNVDDEYDKFFEDEQFSAKGVGEIIDDVTLLNLDSSKIQLSDSDGIYRFISFIFTRCPMPNMCPAVVMKNNYLAKNFNKKNIQFIMISFDYLHDTPSVLKEFYGELLKEIPNWEVFSSTGFVEDVYRLANQTGCRFWGVDENKIGHTLRSVLISPKREVLVSWSGDDWNTEEVKNTIKIVMN